MKCRSKFIQKIEDKLYCYKCNCYLQPCCFDNNSNNWYRDYKEKRCKGCKHLQYIRRRELDHDRVNLDRLLLSRWHGIKERAFKKGFNVDFDYKYLKELWETQKGKCALSGLDMTHVMFSGRILTNVSVDRIDNLKGYTKDNVQLVCMAVNQMKSDMSNNELIEFCNKIINYNKNVDTY